MKKHWIVFREGHPASNPIKHETQLAATQEAHRLAAKMNQKEPFLVYELIGAATVKEPIPPTHFEMAETPF